MAAPVSLEKDTVEADQTRFCSIPNPHEPAIANGDFIAAALPVQFLIFGPELRLQGSNLPIGFRQIEPRDFSLEVAQFHEGNASPIRFRVNTGSSRSVHVSDEGNLIEAD